eukprot:GGOE01032145.1.p2 GENE.GGOE01032145.1~~GGOE01032145.1.p2  ORF type:complete len:124 (+),score=1.62 GGOE01032145.1:770-1141(+)
MIHHLATTQHSACGDWKAIQLGGQPPCGLTTSDPSNSPCLTLKREGPMLLVSHSARHPADANPVGIPPGCSEDQGREFCCSQMGCCCPRRPPQHQTPYLSCTILPCCTPWCGVQSGAKAFTCL